jgi:hypothetical protein
LTTERSEGQALEIELVGLCQRGARDRQILDREAGRVEEGDVARAPPSFGLSCEDEPDVRDAIAGHDPGSDSGCQLAAVTCLLEGVYEWR